jgi:flagellar hook protein FlgE
VVRDCADTGQKQPEQRAHANLLLKFPGSRPIRSDEEPLMNSIAIAFSGMNAATTRLGVAAHNIANAATPAFRRQQVVQHTQANGGVNTSVTQADIAGSDLASDIVAQKVALYSFKANLRTVQVEDEMLGALLDVKA